MPDTVLRFDADVSQVTVKFKKMGDEAKKAGESLGKSMGTSVNGLGAKLEGLAKKVAGIAAVAAAINAGATLMNSVSEKRSGWAEQRNQAALATNSAAMRMGGSAKANAAWIESDQNKLTTREGRQSLADSIASIQEERRLSGQPPISQANIELMKRTYNNGGDLVFGKGGADIAESARQMPYNPGLGLGRKLASRIGEPFQGQGLDGLTSRNLANISGDTRIALSQQALEERNARARLEEGAGGAQVELAINREREYHRITSPYDEAIRDKVGSMTGMGETVELGRRGGAAKDAVDHLKDISGGIKQMANKSGPTLPNLGTRSKDPNGAIAP